MMIQPEPDPQPIIPVAVLEADDLFDWPLAHDLVHEVEEPNEIPTESIPNEQLDVILPNEIQPESQSQLPGMTIPNDEPERETETKWEEAGSNRLSEVLMHGNDDWMCTQPVSDTERSNEDDVKTNNVPNIPEQPMHEISPEHEIQVEPEVREPIESNTRAIYGADGNDALPRRDRPNVTEPPIGATRRLVKLQDDYRSPETDNRCNELRELFSGYDFTAEDPSPDHVPVPREDDDERDESDKDATM